MTLMVEEQSSGCRPEKELTEGQRPVIYVDSWMDGMMNLTDDICSQNYIWVNYFMDQGFKMRVIRVH